MMLESDGLRIIADSIWYALPAYIANMIPVIAGGGRPIDLGKNFIDGKRILGDHKTIRGFLSGVVAGTLVGLIQGRIIQGLLLGLGAMIGDSLGSFIKRRIGIESGGHAPVLDQEGFLVVALVLTAPVETIDPFQVLVLLLITPPLHILMNRLAKALKLKGVGY